MACRAVRIHPVVTTLVSQVGWLGRRGVGRLRARPAGGGQDESRSQRQAGRPRKASSPSVAGQQEENPLRRPADRVMAARPIAIKDAQHEHRSGPVRGLGLQADLCVEGAVDRRRRLVQSRRESDQVGWLAQVAKPVEADRFGNRDRRPWIGLVRRRPPR